MKFVFKTIYFILVLSVIINLLLSDSLSYYDKFNEGVQYYKDRRYKLALDHFRNISINQKNDKDPAAQLFIAKILTQQGDLNDAKNMCKLILSNFPDSPYQVDIHLLLGDIALLQGGETVAFQHYLKARPLVDDLLYINDIDDRIYTCIGN